MTRRSALTLAIALLTAPVTAGAAAIADAFDVAGFAVRVTCVADARSCRTAERAMSTVSYPWRAAGYDVRIVPPPDDWLEGATAESDRRIDLYVDRDRTVADVARTFAHEVGHAVLDRCGQDRLDEWRARRHLPDHVPDTVAAPHDYDSVSEDAAEAFASYLTGRPSRSTVGPELTDAWLRQNTDLFEPC